MGQLLLFFLCNFNSFFSYVGYIPVTNGFSLLLIDRYILAIQQVITHKEHLRYSFWSSELPQKPWHHGHNNRKWLKQPKSHFYVAVPGKSHLFPLFWCMLSTATPDISSSSENMNSMARVSRLFFRILWLCCYQKSKQILIGKASKKCINKTQKTDKLKQWVQRHLFMQLVNQIIHKNVLASL